MGALLVVVVAVAAVVALEVLAYRFGCDSRDGVARAESQRWSSWYDEAARRRRRLATMFDPSAVELHASYRQEELLTEAARHRLLREARRQAPVRRPLAGWLHRVGTRLEAWGWRLQAYGTSAALPSDRPLEAAPQL